MAALKSFGVKRALKNLIFIGYDISFRLQHLSLKNSECTWKSLFWRGRLYYLSLVAYKLPQILLT